MSSERLSALTGWVVEQLGTKNINLKPLTGDASFRGYYRLHLLDSESTLAGAHRTLIVMDAPPPREDTNPEVRPRALPPDTRSTRRGPPAPGT